MDIAFLIDFELTSKCWSIHEIEERLYPAPMRIEKIVERLLSIVNFEIFLARIEILRANLQGLSPVVQTLVPSMHY